MNHLVIDLSSDEEEDDKLVDYSDWFDGISDMKPKSNPTVEDEDCVVLDYDPYKMTTEKVTSMDSYESDEVLVVGQKGEIACRDFPHPRHDCAKYPFKSTSHHKYCEMCHCYVCDIRAPCIHWCVGFSSTDHCHANDKEQTWKNQRERLRTGMMLPCPVPKACFTAPQIQRVSQPRTIPLPQNLSSPLNKLGVRPCSSPARVATQPNTYTRPGYRTEQPRTAPQNPGFDSRAYIGKPSPLGVSSNSFKCARRPSRGVYLADNSKHNIAQGLQYTCSAPPPPTALQGNQQRIVTGYISPVPESQNKVYDKHYNRNMYPGNVQTSAVQSAATVPSSVSHPSAKQQQQSGINTKKVLSEFEDWLMDNATTLPDPVCPLSGQDNATTLDFDLETFLQ